MSDVSGTHQPTQEQLHKMRYYIQSSSTRSSESSQSEFDENKNNAQSQSRQDQSLMLRNMAVISQNINKKNEKKRKDKRNKNGRNEPELKQEDQTSMYSACILSANCLSNATQMLHELTGTGESGRPTNSRHHQTEQNKSELSALMSNLFKLDRTLTVLNQELKRTRKGDE